MYLSIVIGAVSDIPGISNSTLAGDEERSVLHQSDRLCCWVSRQAVPDVLQHKQTVLLSLCISGSGTFTYTLPEQETVAGPLLQLKVKTKLKVVSVM